MAEYQYSQKDLDEIEREIEEASGPDWLAPFHMPTFSTDEFDEARTRYVAEHGFTITVPSLSDVFHFGNPAPMTKQEKWAWKNEKWDLFTDERMEVLLKEKNRKLDMIEQMLSSPTPELFTKLGSILTALDDAQDAISTLAMLARIARKVAPKAVARLISGPIGWAMTASDILNILTNMGQTITMPFMNKRLKDAITRTSAKNRKFRKKKLVKPDRWIPNWADLIQAAQTSDQIFGIGVSLGPLMGFAQDIWWGGIRSKRGEKVQMKLSPHGIPAWIGTAYKTLTSAPAAFALPGIDTPIPTLELLQAQAMGNEAIYEYQQRWAALDQVTNLGQAEFRAPIPEDPLTLNAIDEANLKPEEVTGWPIIDKEWATLDEMTEAYSDEIKNHVNDFIDYNSQNSKGALASSLVAEIAPYQLANIDGTANIEQTYSTASRAASAMLQQNYYPNPTNSLESHRRFSAFLEYENSRNQNLSLKQIVAWARHYGFRLIRKDNPV